MAEHFHVLMVLESSYPSKGGGGAEFQIQTITKNLPSHVKATVIAPKVAEAPQSTHDVIAGTPVYRIPYPKVRLFGGLFMLFSLFIYLIKHRNEYQAIHAHIANNMAGVCCLTGVLLNKPVIVKLTGWLEMAMGILLENTNNPRIRLLKWAMKKATIYQATSKQISTRLVEQGFDPQKIMLIPNAVDINRFTPDNPKSYYREKLGINADFVAVYVGRLVEEKSLDTLLSAWAQAFDHDASVHLLLVGDGYLNDALQKQARSLNINHQITFVGPSNTVELYLFSADVGLLPSIYEGLSNTLLEYMASSLPVIGTQISGTEDLVRSEENGWLFTPKDIDALAKLLQQAKHETAGKLVTFGQAAKTYITEFAGVKSIINKLCKHYGFEQAEHE